MPVLCSVVGGEFDVVPESVEFQQEVLVVMPFPVAVDFRSGRHMERGE